MPLGSIGFRWGEQGKWNLEADGAATARETSLQLSLIDGECDGRRGVPVFRRRRDHTTSPRPSIADVLMRNVPVRHLTLKDGEALVATVFDLLCANYGLDRGLGGDNVASDYDDDEPYTPAWAEHITGVPRDAHHPCRARIRRPTPRRPTAARW